MVEERHSFGPVWSSPLPLPTSTDTRSALVTCAGMLVCVLSIAEMASMAPTAGGMVRDRHVHLNIAKH